jgi:hypothetical protein
MMFYRTTRARAARQRSEVRSIIAEVKQELDRTTWQDPASYMPAEAI